MKAENIFVETLYIIMCKSGIVSDSVAEELRDAGLCAVNLKEGYYGFMLENLKSDKQKSEDKERDYSLFPRFIRRRRANLF